ncbi:hypothetical protein MCAMS1_00958 [biofilm metagenome]
MNKRMAIPLMVLLCLGCSQSPAVQYYVIEPLIQPAPTYQTTRPVTIGIGPITLPEILSTQKIVTRNTGNTVKIAEFHQWASSLDDNFLQALTQNLARLQPAYLFRAYPWSIYGMVDKQIVVDVIRFDATPGESVNLEANWTIKNESDHAVLKIGRSAINRPLNDKSYSGTVKALSNLLADFSRELSVALLQTELSH